MAASHGLVIPIGLKPTGPFHLCRTADKSPCDFDSEPMVLIVLRNAKKKSLSALVFWLLHMDSNHD